MIQSQMSFLIELLETKKENLLKAVQYVDAGTDDHRITNSIGREIEVLEKRIEEIKKMCFVGKDGKYYLKILVEQN